MSQFEIKTVVHHDTLSTSRKLRQANRLILPFSEELERLNGNIKPRSGVSLRSSWPQKESKTTQDRILKRKKVSIKDVELKVNLNRDYYHTTAAGHSKSSQDGNNDVARIKNNTPAKPFGNAEDQVILKQKISRIPPVDNDSERIHTAGQKHHRRESSHDKEEVQKYMKQREAREADAKKKAQLLREQEEAERRARLEKLNQYRLKQREKIQRRRANDHQEDKQETEGFSYVHDTEMISDEAEPNLVTVSFMEPGQVSEVNTLKDQMGVETYNSKKQELIQLMKKNLLSSSRGSRDAPQTRKRDGILKTRLDFHIKGEALHHTNYEIKVEQDGMEFMKILEKKLKNKEISLPEPKTVLFDEVTEDLSQTLEEKVEEELVQNSNNFDSEESMKIGENVEKSSETISSDPVEENVEEKINRSQDGTPNSSIEDGVQQDEQSYEDDFENVVESKPLEPQKTSSSLDDALMNLTAKKPLDDPKEISLDPIKTELVVKKIETVQEVLPPQSESSAKDFASDVKKLMVEKTELDFGSAGVEVLNDLLKKETRREKELDLLLSLKDKTLEGHVKAELNWLHHQRTSHSQDQEQKDLTVQMERSIMMRYMSEKAELEKLKQMNRSLYSQRKKPSKKHTKVAKKIEKPMILDDPTKEATAIKDPHSDFAENQIYVHAVVEKESYASSGSDAIPYSEDFESISASESIESAIDEASLEILSEKLKIVSQNSHKKDSQKQQKQLDLSKKLAKEILNKKKSKLLLEEKIKTEIEKVNRALEKALNSSQLSLNADSIGNLEEPKVDRDDESFSFKESEETSSRRNYVDVYHYLEQNSVSITEVSSIQHSESLSFEESEQQSQTHNKKGTPGDAVRSLILCINDLKKQVEDSKTRSYGSRKERKEKQDFLHEQLLKHEEKLQQQLESLNRSDLIVEEPVEIPGRMVKSPTEIDEQINISFDESKESIQVEDNIADVSVNTISEEIQTADELEPIQETLAEVKSINLEIFSSSQQVITASVLDAEPVPEEIIMETAPPFLPLTPLQEVLSRIDLNEEVLSDTLADQLFQDIYQEILNSYKSNKKVMKTLEFSMSAADMDNLPVLETATSSQVVQEFAEKIEIRDSEVLPLSNSVLEEFQKKPYITAHRKIAYKLLFDAVNQTIAALYPRQEDDLDYFKVKRKWSFSNSHLVVRSRVMSTVSKWIKYKELYGEDMDKLLGEVISEEEKEWLDHDTQEAVVQNLVFNQLWQDILEDTVYAVELVSH